MEDLNNLQLLLWNCQRVRSRADVVDVLRVIRDHELTPATGHRSTPGDLQLVTDIEAFVASGRTSIDAYLPRPPTTHLAPREGWGARAIRPSEPGTECGLWVQRRNPAIWEIGIRVWASSHGQQPLEEFCASWGDLLERTGAALYWRTRPALAYLTAEPEEAPGLAPAADQGRLIVGWRTWFGPPYAQRYGREWLLGLPDQTVPLADGGVFHALDAPAVDLVTDTRDSQDAYARVWPYLRERRLHPAWPQPPLPRRQPTQAELEQEMAEFRRYLIQEVTRVQVLDDGRRLKKLRLGWDLVSAEQRRLALDAVREAAERELRQHPEATIHFEFNDIPPDLQSVLDSLASAHGQHRLTSAAIPNLSL